MADFCLKDNISPASFFALGSTYSVPLDKWHITDTAADYVFVGNESGLTVSSDGGETRTMITSAVNGLPDDEIRAVFVQGSTVYVGTKDSGIAKSTDNGQSWAVTAPGENGLPELSGSTANQNAVNSI